MEREGWSDPDIAKGYAAEFEVATRVVAEKLSDAVVANVPRVFRGAAMYFCDFCITQIVNEYVDPDIPDLLVRISFHPFSVCIDLVDHLLTLTGEFR